MISSPPEGSEINLEESIGATTITIAHEDKSASTRFSFIILLIVWLIGWGAGVGGVLGLMPSAKSPILLYIWLGGWITGGALAWYKLYQLLGPSIPETLKLQDRKLFYDSGVPPTKMAWRMPWIGKFRLEEEPSTWTRVRIEFDQNQMRSLSIKKAENGTRLMVTSGTAHIELGMAATEVERAWLHKALITYFG